MLIHAQAHRFTEFLQGTRQPFSDALGVVAGGSCFHPTHFVDAPCDEVAFGWKRGEFAGVAKM